MPAERPRGTEEVRRALLEAAIDAYASGAPFSAREIARQAGVNHAQVHHLFGGKEGLRRAMLEHLAAAQDEAIAQADDASPRDVLLRAVAVAFGEPRFIRVLARTLLEHPDDPIPQRAFPVVRRLRRALEASNVEDADERLAEGLAAALGLAFFGPWIRAATGVGPDLVTQLRRGLVRELEAAEPSDGDAP